MRQTGPKRGSALIVVMIVLVVMTLLVAGALKFTGTNREAAVSKMRGDRAQACAEAARNYLISRLNLYGVQTSGLSMVSFNQLTVTQTLPDDPTPANRMVMMTGHYNDTTAQPTVVEVVASSTSSAQQNLRELTNAAPTSRTMGQTFRVIVKCMEPIPAAATASYVARESEMEFEFKYGGL